MRRHLRTCLAVLLLLPAACSVERPDGADTTTAAAPVPVPPPTDTAPAPAASTLAVEVDLAARKLRVLDNGQPAGEYGVAVGSAEWPTRTGEWTITQVVWNPEWVPPQDESWAEDEEPKQPGDPENPLGRVQLVYDPPRTIHGTNEPGSIGKAVSHGSIRMTNESAIALAKRVMDAGGAAKDAAWFDRVQSNRREKVIVDLPSPVTIRVR